MLSSAPEKTFEGTPDPVLTLVRPEPGVPVSTEAEVERWLRCASERLVLPWNWWTWACRRRLRRKVLAELENLGAETRLPARHLEESVVEAVERVIGPYRNRLTFPAYAFLLGSVGLNACVVTYLASYPAMATFAATFGGTLAGALGYQVIARLQAWAKQVSSNGGSLRTERIPFNGAALDIWRRSQQMKSDLPRDGRNIRKDAWLQLHPRLEKALALPETGDAAEAIADALIDHRQSYGEVCLDYWLAREFHRNLKARFANDIAYQQIRRVFRETASRHRLPVEDLDRMLSSILRPETWR